MGKKKGIDYFEELETLVKTSSQTAKFMAKSLKNFDGGIGEEQVKEIHALEHGGDLQKHDLMNHLLKEFITPIEREDIVSIAQKIDDVTDAIEDVLIKMYMFNVTEVRPASLDFSNLIIRCCESLREVMKEFHHFKKPAKLRELMIEVHRIENEGDSLYTNAVRELYTSSASAVDLGVWTEIYRKLELCLDVMEDVVDDVEMVLMKNS